MVKLKSVRHTRWAGKSRISRPRDAPDPSRQLVRFASHFALRLVSSRLVSSCLIRIPAPSLYQDRRVSLNRTLSDCSACLPPRKHASPRADNPLSACVAHSPRQSGSVGDSIAGLEGSFLYIGGSPYVFLISFRIRLRLAFLDHHFPPSYTSRPSKQISFCFSDNDVHHYDTVRPVAGSTIPVRFFLFPKLTPTRRALILSLPSAYKYTRIWPR